QAVQRRSVFLDVALIRSLCAKAVGFGGAPLGVGVNHRIDRVLVFVSIGDRVWGNCAGTPAAGVTAAERAASFFRLHGAAGGVRGAAGETCFGKSARSLSQ